MANARTTDEVFVAWILSARNDQIDPPFELLAGDQATIEFFSRFPAYLERNLILFTRHFFHNIGTNLNLITNKTRRAHRINPTFIDSLLLYTETRGNYFSRHVSVRAKDAIHSYLRDMKVLFTNSLRFLPSPIQTTADAISKGFDITTDQLKETAAIIAPHSDIFGDLTTVRRQANVNFVDGNTGEVVNPSEDFPDYEYGEIGRRFVEKLKAKKDGVIRLKAALTGNLTELRFMCLTLLDLGVGTASLAMTLLTIANAVMAARIEKKNRAIITANITTRTGLKIVEVEELEENVWRRRIQALDQRVLEPIIALETDDDLLHIHNLTRELKKSPDLAGNAITRRLIASLTTHYNNLTRIYTIITPANISDDDLHFLRLSFPSYKFRKYNTHSPHPLADTVRRLFTAHINQLCRTQQVMIGGNSTQNQARNVIHCCAGAPDARQKSRFIGKVLNNNDRHNFQDCSFNVCGHTAVSVYSAQEMSIADFAVGMIKKGIEQGYVCMMLPLAFLNPEVERWEDDVLGVEFRRQDGKIYMTYLDHAALGYVDCEEKVMSWMSAPPRIPGGQIFVEEVLRVGSAFLLSIRVVEGIEVETVISWRQKETFLTLPLFEPAERTKAKTITISTRRFSPLVTYVLGLPADKRTLTNVMNRLRGNLAEIKIGGKIVNKMWKINERDATSIAMHAITCAFLRIGKAEVQSTRVWGQNQRDKNRHSDNLWTMLRQKFSDFVFLRSGGEENLHFNKPTWTGFWNNLFFGQMKMIEYNIYDVPENDTIVFRPKRAEEDQAMASRAFFVYRILRPIAANIIGRFVGNGIAEITTDGLFDLLERRAIQPRLPPPQVRRNVPRSTEPSIDDTIPEPSLTDEEGEIWVDNAADEGNEETHDSGEEDLFTAAERGTIPTWLHQIDEDEEPINQGGHFDELAERDEIAALRERRAAELEDLRREQARVRGTAIVEQAFEEEEEPIAGPTRSQILDCAEEGSEYSSLIPSEISLDFRPEPRRPNQLDRCQTGYCTNPAISGQVCSEHSSSVEPPVIDGVTRMRLPIDAEHGFNGVINFGGPITLTEGGSNGNARFYNTHKNHTEDEILQYFEDHAGEYLHGPDNGMAELVLKLINKNRYRDANETQDQERRQELVQFYEGHVGEVISLRRKNKTHLYANSFERLVYRPHGARTADLHLTGPGGASKTSLLAKILHKYAGRRVLFVCPTNELMEKAKQEFSRMPARITFGCMHTIPFILEKTGRKKKDGLDETVASRYELTIVDECYNMPRNVVDVFCAVAKRSLVIGDKKQIGPVVAQIDERREEIDDEQEEEDIEWKPTFCKIVELTVSFTIPLDILTFLISSGCYSPLFQTASKVHHSVFRAPMRSYENEETRAIHFATADQLPFHNIPVENLITINKAQGKRLDHTLFLTTRQNRTMPHFQPRHVLSALTRHSKTITFVEEEPNCAATVLNPRNYQAVALEPQPEVTLAVVNGIMSRFRRPAGIEFFYATFAPDVSSVLGKAIVAQNENFLCTQEKIETTDACDDATDREERADYVQESVTIEEMQQLVHELGKEENAGIAILRTDVLHMDEAPTLTHVTTDAGQEFATTGSSVLHSTEFLSFVHSSNSFRQSCFNAVSRSSVKHKSVCSDLLELVPEICEDFKKAFLKPEFSIALDRQAGATAWLNDRLKTYAGESDAALFETGYTTKLEQFLKTQSKPALAKIHDGGYKPGQDVQASSKAFCAMVCPDAREFSANLRDAAREGLIIDAGYNAEEFEAALKRGGFYDEFIEKGTTQIDITSQSTTHTIIHVAVLCYLFIWLGGPKEIADLYFEMRVYNEIKEKRKFFRLYNQFKLTSGDPFTLIANIVHSLLCLLFRFAVIIEAKVRLITKGDDNTLTRIDRRPSEKYHRLEKVLDIGLKIDDEFFPYHASRFILRDCVFPDFVKATLNALTRVRGVPLEELYQSWISRGFSFREEMRDELICGAVTACGVSADVADICLRFCSAMMEREFFFSFYHQDSTDNTGLISAPNDCVVAVAKALGIVESDWNICRGKNAFEVREFFEKYGFEVRLVFEEFDVCFSTEELNVVFVFIDHVVVRVS